MAPADDTHWMAQALEEARRAAAAGEVPIGAVVVMRGEVYASAHNRTLGDCDPTAHAEIVALRDAARRAANHRLPEAVLYVTAEPCIMCVGAIVQARIAQVVFGCRDPKAGALGSVYETADHARLNHRFAVTGGVAAEECAALLQEFFRARRADGPQ
jgi:tRNA(adenine34) deaminase